MEIANDIIKFKKNIQQNLSADWITGFVDGEGCFCVSLNFREKLKVGIEVRPSFSISQKKDKLNINFVCLNLIKNFFGCGFVRFCKNDGIWKYECRNVKELKDKIIPHFKNYSLCTKKQIDFTKFFQVIDIINKNEHLSKKGILEIIELSYQLNGGKRKWKKEDLVKYVEKRCI